MPTTCPDHLVTETHLVARALDDAAKRWPEDRDNRAKLLLHLIEQGHRALILEAAKRREARLAAIRRTSGALTGAYGLAYLEELPEGWPT